MAGSSSFSSAYLRCTEPMMVFSHRGMAMVRNALSSGPLTGEPSAFLPAAWW
jgi:hypothetical protein